MEVYIVFLFSLILALLAQRTNKKVWVVLQILLLSAFVGFRGVEIGDDTRTYQQFFDLLENDVYSPSVEMGFLLFCKGILLLFGNTRAIFVLVSLITNTCILFRLWLFKDKVSYFAASFLYLVFFYPDTCNIMRQSLAVSVIFISTVLLEKKHYLLFATVIALATLIHTSSLVYLSLIPLHILFSSDTSKKQKRTLLVILVFLMPLIIAFIVLLFKRYSFYFENSNNDFGLMGFAQLGTVIVTSLVFSNSTFFKNVANNGERHFLYDNRFILFSYLVGIAFIFLGYYKTTLLRIGLCFNLFSMIYIPLVCSKKSNGYLISRLLYFVIVGYYIYADITVGWFGLSGLSYFLG